MPNLLALSSTKALGLSERIRDTLASFEPTNHEFMFSALLPEPDAKMAILLII
jgi:hypothetical protein